METAPQPQTLSNNEGKPFDGNLIRDKMQETLGWTSQGGIPRWGERVPAGFQQVCWLYVALLFLIMAQVYPRMWQTAQFVSLFFLGRHTDF